MNSDLPNIYTDNPSRRESNPLGFGTVDKWFLAGVIALVVIAQYLVGYFSVGIVIAGGILWIGRNRGRLYYVLWGRFVADPVFIGFWHRKILWSARLFRLRKRRGNYLSSILGSCKVRNLGGYFGLLHILRRQTDVAVIIGTGNQNSAADLVEMNLLFDRLAEQFKMVAALRGYPIGLALLSRRRPLNATRARAVQNRYLHPDVVVPKAFLSRKGDFFTEEERTALSVEERRDVLLHANQQERLALRSAHGGEVTMALVLTVRHEQEMSDAVRKGAELSRSKAERLHLFKAVAAATEALVEHGVTDVRTLDAPDLRDFLREGLDIKNIDVHHQRQFNMTAEERATESLEDVWPVEQVEVGKDFIVIDGTYHRVIEIDEGPDQIHPLSFRRLHSIDGWYSTAIVGEVFAAINEYRRVDFFDSLAEEKQERATGGGRVREHDRSKNEKRERKLRSLNESGYVYVYNQSIAVSATNKDDLDNTTDEAEKQIRGSRMVPSTVSGLTEQFAAVFEATVGSWL